MHCYDLHSGGAFYETHTDLPGVAVLGHYLAQA